MSRPDSGASILWLQRALTVASRGFPTMKPAMSCMPEGCVNAMPTLGLTCISKSAESQGMGTPALPILAHYVTLHKLHGS